MLLRLLPSYQWGLLSQFFRHRMRRCLLSGVLKSTKSTGKLKWLVDIAGWQGSMSIRLLQGKKREHRQFVLHREVQWNIQLAIKKGRGCCQSNHGKHCVNRDLIKLILFILKNSSMSDTFVPLMILLDWLITDWWKNLFESLFKISNIHFSHLVCIC